MTASRFGTRTARAGAAAHAAAFDVLHLDGEDLLDRPRRRARRDPATASSRRAARSPRIVADERAAAQAVFDAALAAGHEGVVVKSLDAPYAAGRRGGGG